MTAQGVALAKRSLHRRCAAPGLPVQYVVEAHMCPSLSGNRTENNAGGQLGPKLTSVFPPRAPDLTLTGGPQEGFIFVYISPLSILTWGLRGEELKLISDRVEGLRAAMSAPG